MISNFLFLPISGIYANLTTNPSRTAAWHSHAITKCALQKKLHLFDLVEAASVISALWA